MIRARPLVASSVLGLALLAAVLPLRGVIAEIVTTNIYIVGADEVEDEDVYVVGIQSSEQVMEEDVALPDEPRLSIASIRLSAADVSGDYDFVPASFKSGAKIVAIIREGENQVEVVDPSVDGLMYYRNHRLTRLLVQVLRSQPDSAYLQAGSSQYPSFHGCPPCVLLRPFDTGLRPTQGYGSSVYPE